MGSQGPKLSSWGQRRLWSDWVDTQADPSLRWAHMPVCWFCHDAAQVTLQELNCSQMLSHITRKPAFQVVQPSKTQTSQLKYSTYLCSKQQRHWCDRVDVQADLVLLAYGINRFCHVSAEIIPSKATKNTWTQKRTNFDLVPFNVTCH